MDPNKLNDNALETQADLEAFITEMNVQDDPDALEPVEEISESGDTQVPDDDETPADEAARIRNDASDDDNSEDDSQSDEKPVEDRFQELSKSIAPDEADEASQLAELETQLQVEGRQLQNADILNGLPNLVADGKSIYAMEPAELNQQLMQLRDAGKELEADQMSQAYNAACMRVQQYVQLQQQHQVKQQELKDKKSFQEWKQCREQWLVSLPEVEAHIPKIAQYIDQKSQTDPATALLVETQPGKMRAILQAIRELGIDKELAKSTPKAVIKTPSAPDAQAASKKVTNSNTTVPFTREQIGKMSDSEYLQNEKEIDRQMEAGLIK